MGSDDFIELIMIYNFSRNCVGEWIGVIFIFVCWFIYCCFGGIFIFNCIIVLFFIGILIRNVIDEN